MQRILKDEVEIRNIFLLVPDTKTQSTFSACCVQNSVFGEGTYLTSDLSMAVLYSPHSSGWRESLLGPLLSCVALCEVIDHPDVKCQVKKKGVLTPCIYRVGQT